MIRGIGEMNLRETRTPVEYKDAMGSMLEEVDRLTRLVDTLLQLSRGDAGTVRLSREAVDLGQLTRDVMASLGILAEERQQQVKVEAADNVRVSADRLVLRDAITNVIDNAIKYSPNGSTIDVSVHREGDRATVSVTGQGPGIPAEHRERIFDRFYRIDEGRSRELGVRVWGSRSQGGRSRPMAATFPSAAPARVPSSASSCRWRCLREVPARYSEDAVHRMEPEMMTTAILGSVLLAAGAAETVNFDKNDVGKPPAGWTATQTGTGQAKWAVVLDDTAPSKPNVLKQSGQATYPICLKEDTRLKDGFVEVKFKALSGKEDQAGGVVWRAKDANNYYIARANALENNVTIYHTINGRRTEKKRANMKVPPNQWHTLRVDFQGSHFTVLFNGQKALDWDDETFRDAGQVGVWTKADSVTVFDDFSYGSR